MLTRSGYINKPDMHSIPGKNNQNKGMRSKYIQVLCSLQIVLYFY